MDPTTDLLSRGVGTELERLFHRIGMPSCSACESMAQTLNYHGIDWCVDNFHCLIITILDRTQNWKWTTRLTMGVRMIFLTPYITGLILIRKLRYPLTSFTELAVVTLVDQAIERAKKDQNTNG